MVIIFNNNIIEQMATLLRFERFASLLLNNMGAKCKAKGAKGDSQVQISRFNSSLRLFGAGTINIVGLAIVTTTIPVFLCTSETYMDFVLNAAATIFIVQLDDLTHSTTIVLEVQEMTSIIIRRGDDLPEYY